jgi:hypothetical protein
MSEVKVNKVSPRSGTGLQLGDSGDTITIPSGATIDNQGTATNFGATGSASWVTTVKTSTFTAVAGEGYFVNTTGGAVTVNLPAGTAGDVVAIKDYANTFDTNAVTLVQNGSDKIGGDTANKRLTTEGIAVTLVFVDSTKGWLVTDDGQQDSVKGLTYSASFLVVAGGGGGGFDRGGGGGAGGYRAAFGSEASGGGGSAESPLTLEVGTVYTVTVGDGGVGGSSGSEKGTTGNDSSISGAGITTITSLGGGGAGAGFPAERDGLVGGSGGGDGYNTGAPGAAGTANQGYAGGAYGSGTTAAGGGGAGGVGVGTSPYGGGTGVASTITGSSVTRGGGGGGHDGSSSAPPGGSGGGGAGGQDGGANGQAGTANTGGGGGGGKGSPSPYNGGDGGKGVVIISIPDANYSGTTTGSPTVATGVSGQTVITFNSSGSYTG